MLKRLYIKNFTLIDELDMQFYPGFSVITGETGAGKSIIVGAVGQLLGNRAEIKSIKSGKDKCVIEARFHIESYNMRALFEENDVDYDETECIIRRELNSNGKSRAFINDTPVPLSTMKIIGENLLDVHSQHQNLLLNKEDFQLNILDIIAHTDSLLADYQKHFHLYTKEAHALAQLKESISSQQTNEDFMRFQLNELQTAQIKVGEQKELEQEVETLSHSEDIKMALCMADNAFWDDNIGIISQLKNIEKGINDIVNVYPEVEELASRLSSCQIELSDIADEINGKVDNIDFEPQRLDTLNSRLDMLYSIQQKYHVNSEEELIAIQTKLESQLETIDNSDELLKEKEAEVEKLLALCTEKANALTAKRIEAVPVIEAKMLEKLVPLGIPNARFKVEHSTKPLSNDGADKIVFLFSANKSSTLNPVSVTASGGEIARVMLSLKALVSGVVKLPTIIFDEIDTGVSGSVAEKMAQIMEEMGNNNRQVISITHLPQIAAIGSTHYKVTKEETENGTISSMNKLNNTERIEEIAKMLSGSDISQAAIDNAKTLLKL